MIEDRNLMVGTVLVAPLDDGTVEAECEQSEDGLRIRLRGDEWAEAPLFRTPSGAGKYVRAGQSTNGWAFWFREDEGGIVETAPRAWAKVNGAKLEDGREFCNACMAAHDEAGCRWAIGVKGQLVAGAEMVS